MSLSTLDLKRVYYYTICLMTFFVLMWGTVDLVSSTVGILNIRGVPLSLTEPSEEAPLPAEKGEQFFDAYYQKKMLYDRFWDSLARIIVSGIIFSYCRIKVGSLEKKD